MELIGAINELAIGDFIKVTQTNGPIDDRLNFAGKVVLHQGTRLEVHTIDGVIGIGWNMSGVKLEVYKLDQKPNGWDKYNKNSHKEPIEIDVPNIKTKKEKIFDLVQNNPKKPLTGLITMAKKQVGGDEAMLSSFIQLAISKFRSA